MLTESAVPSLSVMTNFPKPSPSIWGTPYKTIIRSCPLVPTKPDVQVREQHEKTTVTAASIPLPRIMDAKLDRIINTLKPDTNDGTKA